MRALIQALGPVQTERFIAPPSRDRFDYSEWRKTGLPAWDLETLSAQAAQYANILDHWQPFTPLARLRERGWG